MLSSSLNTGRLGPLRRTSLRLRDRTTAILISVVGFLQSSMVERRRRSGEAVLTVEEGGFGFSLLVEDIRLPLLTKEANSWRAQRPMRVCEGLGEIARNLDIRRKLKGRYCLLCDRRYVGKSR